MSTFRLATRNLLRSPRRTLLTTIAIVAGIGVFILGQGFLGGIDENIVMTAIDGTTGHVLVRPGDYPTQPGQHPVDTLIELSPADRRLLDEEAVAWTERLLFTPTVAAGPDSIRALGIGFDPQRDEEVFPRKLWKVDGAMPAGGRREVAVSHRVARLLGVKVGDRLVLQQRTQRGAMNALEVTVSGRVTTSNPALDTLGVFVPKGLARELLATEHPSHVAIKLQGRDAAAAFAEKLRASMGEEVKVSTWADETAELLELQMVRRKALNLVVFILLALAGFGIANTILMAAHERIREVGTLRSLGMTEGGVLRLFLVEGSLMGLVGSIVGALLGGSAIAWWSKNPLDFSKQFEQQGSTLPVSAWVYTHFDETAILAAVLLGVAVATLASIYPARVASRMVPADAVRAS